MALRYSYDARQGGWVLDNHGLFQTPRRIAHSYGQNTNGFKAYQPEAGNLVLGYGRDRRRQCYVDPEGRRGAPCPPGPGCTAAPAGLYQNRSVCHQCLG